MSEERPPGVLGGLPHTRPHRRSDKRPAMVVEPAAGDAPAIPPAPRPAASAKATPTPKPAASAKATAAPKRAPSAKAAAAPKRPAARPAPPPAHEPDAGALGTAVQAAAELAEIGLMASARALRSALSRLPRR